VVLMDRRDGGPEVGEADRASISEWAARSNEGRAVKIAHRRVVAAMKAGNGDATPLRHPREKLLALLKDAEPGTVFERLPGQLELFPEVEAAELRLLDRMFDRISRDGPTQR
jgi:hypothetical protein